MNQVYYVLELAIQEGQAENFDQIMQEMVANAQNEPGTLNYEWSLSADGKVCHTFERFADSEALLAHLGGFGQFADRFMTVFSPTGLTVYGSPNDQAKAALAAFNPTYMRFVGGFAR